MSYKYPTLFNYFHIAPTAHSFHTIEHSAFEGIILLLFFLIFNIRCVYSFIVNLS